MNSMETTPSNKRRRWPMLLLHLVAWGIVLAVGVAFVFANVRENRRMEEVDVDSPYHTYYGSPPPISYEHGFPISYEKNWNHYHIPLFFDVVLGLLIVAATFFVFVSPLWRRRKRFQVKLESLFILTATVAVFCTLYRVTPPNDLLYWYPRTYFSPAYLFFNLFPLYLQIPLGLGIGCAIYWYLWIILRLIAAPIRILAKRRAAPSE